MQDATLVFLLKENQILLGYKKQRFGAGKWNGFGGKIEDGESIASAAARELREESSVIVAPDDLILVARIEFFFPAKPEWDQIVHAFIARHWIGEPTESDEMRPQWFDTNAIPYATMWADDQHWLPRVLRGARVNAKFTFGADNETITDAEIQERSNLGEVE
ncbi:MAG: 8-oxo-dGTP diphosphatase [Chloroflexi bacterium]|nr:8-oxo-dGTP diphosphatase [Chloroflexota bacterium]